jgi:predicted transcriptional regulator
MNTASTRDNVAVTTTVDYKTLILEQIAKAPGIRYRELLRLTGLTNGTLEYHLKILERMHKVNVDRHDGRRARYYSIDMSANDAHIIGYVRNNVARQIVSYILEHDLCTFREIVEHISKAPSTASWHLKRLHEAGIVTTIFGQEYQLYRVLNNILVKEVLWKYKENSWSEMAKRYYEMFGEL